MAEEEMWKEVDEVKIKHRGQCPSYKGHSWEGFAFTLGLILAGAIGIGAFISLNTAWEDDAISHQAGTRLPLSQHFVWNNN